MAIYVAELHFDDEKNVEEIAAHGITTDQVAAVLEGNPRFRRNKRGHAATHKMIGPDNSGIMLTVPIMPTHIYGLWQPVTAWPSTREEITRWRQAK